MTKMESLYQEFKKYFDYDRMDIDYFLDMLKTVKEDKWQYEYQENELTYPKYKIKKLIYGNIKIDYIYDLFWKDSQEEAEIIITAKVNNIIIFKTEDKTIRLTIKIIDFIERVEKRQKEK